MSTRKEVEGEGGATNGGAEAAKGGEPPKAADSSDEDTECPRGVRLLRRVGGDRWAARVACLREGVKALGEFPSSSLASLAWDEEMCRRFLLSSVLPVLNDAAAAGGRAGLGSGTCEAQREAEREAEGGNEELLEALLCDDAWHDVLLCGIGPGGSVPPNPPTSVSSTAQPGMLVRFAICCLLHAARNSSSAGAPFSTFLRESPTATGNYRPQE